MKYLTIRVTAFEQNCSLAWCEATRHCCIIDPGGDIQSVIKTIEANELKPEAIFLTHAHLDHVGGTQELAAHYSLPVIGPHIADQFLLDALPEQATMFQFPHCEPFRADRYLEHSDTVSFGDETFEVRFTPGHSPGHVVFYHKDDKTVFVGDVIFAGSIGRADLPGGNQQQLIDAIKSQLWTLDDNVTIVPGHGPETTIGQEKATNPYVR